MRAPGQGTTGTPGLLALLAALAGCDAVSVHQSTPPPSAAAIAVSVAPPQAAVAARATQQFRARVSGATQASVTWNVNGLRGGDARVGTVSAAGLYTAPATVPNPNPVAVTAVSEADPNQSASASVTVMAPPAVPSVQITPNAAIVPTATNLQFRATVTGLTDTRVTWSVNGIRGGALPSGTVSAQGLYSAPPITPAAGPVNVTVTSLADPSRSAKAILTLIKPGGAAPLPRVVRSSFYDSSSVLFRQDSGGGFDAAHWGPGTSAGTGAVSYPGPRGDGRSPAAFASGASGYAFLALTWRFRGGQWYAMKLHVAELAGQLTDYPVLFVGGNPDHGQTGLPNTAVNSGGAGWYAFNFMYDTDGPRTLRLGVGTNGVHRAHESITVDGLDCELVDAADSVPSEPNAGPEIILYPYANPNRYDPATFALTPGVPGRRWTLEPAHSIVGIGDSEGYDAYNRYFGLLRHFAGYEVHGMFVPGSGASDFLSYLNTWISAPASFGSTAGGASWLPGGQGVYAGGVVPHTLIAGTFVNDIAANGNSAGWNTPSVPGGATTLTNLERKAQAIHQLALAIGFSNVIFTTTGPFQGNSHFGANDVAFAHAFNAFILSPHNGWRGVDIYTALGDPANPDHLLPAYDIGDHLHWSDLTTAPWGTGNQVVMAALDAQLQRLRSAGGGSQWIQVDRAMNARYFSTPSLNKTLQLFLLPQGSAIQGIAVAPAEAFTGGSISGLTLSIGTKAAPAKYGAALDVHASPPFPVYSTPASIAPESATHGAVITVTATATGDTLDHLTAGSVDIWAKVVN